MTIGFLPKKITSNELFTRVFGYYIFEVQAAELPKTYITKHSYHGNGKVQYEFYFNDQINRLIITERHIQTNEIFQLIPHNCFQTELPDAFVSKYSHWWNAKKQILEFRSISFKNTDFLDNKPYILSLKTGSISTTDKMNTQTLVNQSSTFFKNLFNHYFIRLDDKPYVYMMKDDTSQNGIIIHIHLSRLGIAFKYNSDNHIIISREYSDMCIEENQWLGTLTGLKSGLLLSPLSINNQKLEKYPYRKLIVPFGKIYNTKTGNNHQIVKIKRTSSLNSFNHQYFVFILNDRLKILQSTDSPTGWLYLALLHAKTSHPLPDQYTEMTGMERAFQLLKSAGCWSDQPYDKISRNILKQIAAISPKVNYYPNHLKCMITIDWNSNNLPYSMQHFGYYLIAKNLIDASQHLDFMYSSTISGKIPKIFEEKSYNTTLLKKLYWDYRNSYNPLARLSPEMELDISSTSCKELYKLPSKHGSDMTNYTTLRLLDLYNSGNLDLRDCSNQHWLPLSQWLSNENQLKTIWIGLLKMTDCLKQLASKNKIDSIERFNKLIDFLHYISDKINIKPFYLQMLKTELKIPTVLSTVVKFPAFIKYSDIEEISVIKEDIEFESDLTLRQRKEVIAEIKDCLANDREFEDDNDLLTSEDINDFKKLLKHWRNNKKLRSFLKDVQNRICSVSIEQFHTQISYYPQQFTLELLNDHHQIKFKSTDQSIDRESLLKAQQIFHHSYTNSFNKSTVSIKTVNQQKRGKKRDSSNWSIDEISAKYKRTTEMQSEAQQSTKKDVLHNDSLSLDYLTQRIFPSINDQENHLSEITNYFKNQLVESWKKFLSEEQIQNNDPSIKEIINILDCLRQESTKFWNELIKSITLSNEQLFKTGLLLRITPTTLISYFLENSTKFDLTTNQSTLLGGILVNWTLEQQLERALYFINHNKNEDFKKEISNIPHKNWIPSKQISWLILELEMNITIREQQIKVAYHMMDPTKTENNNTIKSIVMQMNMGEGKTSVILPMLALSLSSSSSSSLIRMIVLKSLFPTNYQSLKYKLGNLLNRRILPFFCRRDMNFNIEQIKKIYNRFHQALNNCDIILTSREDILSFDLLTIDKCRQNEFNIGCSMLTIQRWLKTYIRDILDESDEILHVKYQLIYTIGGQQQIDGGEERWKIIQLILNLVKKYAQEISQYFNEEICYKSSEKQSTFPQFRLQSSQPYSLLCEKIANDWIKNKKYYDNDKQMILSFILNTNSSIEHLINKFSHNDIQLFLIIRGLLSSEVLLVALKKRYRVNYGINTDTSFNRLMAVPFRAKDVIADRTEFGHPDIALVLTQLSYYYSGLNNQQLIRCLNRLNQEEINPASIYDQWILFSEGDDIPNNIKQWKGINIKDYQQRINYLFPTLRYNMLVINYFLNHFVFPREAKQFPYKLISSAWDLSSSLRSKIITGFSGTNDTQLLLPIHIRQYDLPELKKTDAIVLNNLLKSENEYYHYLPINASSNEILNVIINSKEIINVILDVGALFIDGTNRDIAIKWLNLSNRNQIDYVIYFDFDSIFVCDRQYNHHRFETSPASERLDHCLFYLDEIHTRGTDFKFPKEFRAALTLGNGLTKDRFVQASMRMRKLGYSHSLTFFSSYEVHQQIIRLKNNLSHQNSVYLIDILRWVYDNTIQSTWDGLHPWASQSLSFQRKIAAFQQIDWNNHQQQFTKIIMKKLAQECLEPEIIELIHMYGGPKSLLTLIKIHSDRYEQTNHHISTDIQQEVLKRLLDYGGQKQRLSQLLDEEQQRELEQELEEERQVARPSPVKPHEPILHKEIERLCDINSDIMNLSQFPLVFQRLACAFMDTTFYNDCQPNSWQSNLWISTEFQRIILTQGESLNPFLRPPRWVVIYRNQYIIFVSAYEANWLIHHLKSNKSSITTLRLLLPRIKRNQSIFFNTSTLTIPPLISSFNNTNAYFIPLAQLVQLFIFNGTLYFETVDEQTAYCHCLGLCPQPRTTIEEQAFAKQWIAADGFVSRLEHRQYLQMNQVRFNSNPLAFVKQLIENRNNSHAPITSHVGSIILNSLKLI